MSSTLRDGFQFEVPILPTLLQNTAPRSRLESSSQSSRLAGNGFNIVGSASARWGGSTSTRSRRDERTLENIQRSAMPPPRAPGFGFAPKPHRAFANDTTIQSSSLFHNRMMHSTPVHNIKGSQRSQSLLRPLTDSTMASTNWSGLGSSESVRSFMSNNNEFVEKLFQKALNKFLIMGHFNPEYEDLAIQVANGLKNCAQEVAQEIVPDTGSVRSHYSKYASTWRSGASVISGQSQDAFQSLLNIKQVASRSCQKASSAKSVQCSMERVDKKRRHYQGRITEEPAESQFTTTFSVVERTIETNKRSPSPDSGSDRERSEPQTVRRKLNNDTDIPVSTAVQGFESPTSTTQNHCDAFTAAAAAKKKGAKPTLADALAGLTGILTVDDNDETPTVRKRNKPTKKKPAGSAGEPKSKKRPPKPDSIRISDVAILIVSNTRSGRNVKKPSFYQAPGKPKSRKTVAANTNSSNMTDKKVEESKVEKLPKKPAIKKAPKSTVQTLAIIDEPIVFTKRGRVVKPTVLYGAIKTFSPSPAVTNPAPKKITSSKPIAAQSAKNKNGKSLKATVTQPSVPQDIDDDGCDGELSMSGIDFFIPEVTQSTRRGVARSKYEIAKAIAAQTPPLTHFTANLHSEILASASQPGQPTPDWQPSKRTQSEARKLQKRKLKQKKIKPEPPKKKVSLQKKALTTQQFAKLAKTKMIQSASTSFESDGSSDSEIE